MSDSNAGTIISTSGSFHPSVNPQPEQGGSIKITTPGVDKMVESGEHLIGEANKEMQGAGSFVIPNNYLDLINHAIQTMGSSSTTSTKTETSEDNKISSSSNLDRIKIGEPMTIPQVLQTCEETFKTVARLLHGIDNNGIDNGVNGSATSESSVNSGSYGSYGSKINNGDKEEAFITYGGTIKGTVRGTTTKTSTTSKENTGEVDTEGFIKRSSKSYLDMLMLFDISDDKKSELYSEFMTNFVANISTNILRTIMELAGDRQKTAAAEYLNAGAKLQQIETYKSDMDAKIKEEELRMRIAERKIKERESENNIITEANRELLNVFFTSVGSIYNSELTKRLSGEVSLSSALHEQDPYFILYQKVLAKLMTQVDILFQMPQHKVSEEQIHSAVSTAKVGSGAS